jgi:hypothetical protein
MRQGVIGAALAMVLLGSTAAHARQSALVLEGAYLSLSADVAGESQPARGCNTTSHWTAEIRPSA